MGSKSLLKEKTGPEAAASGPVGRGHLFLHTGQPAPCGAAVEQQGGEAGGPLGQEEGQPHQRGPERAQQQGQREKEHKLAQQGNHQAGIGRPQGLEGGTEDHRHPGAYEGEGNEA